jgi:adenosylmethionine-8-amino-7-oxononanoate aminotransferase
MNKPDPKTTAPLPIGHSPKGGGVQHFWLPKGTPRLPRITRGDGVYVWDADGRRYLDGTCGPLAVSLGHGNRRVLEAMRAQAERICYAYPSYFESESNTQLADLLTELAGPGFDRCFFVNSGAEAVEKAIEFARLHAAARGDTSRVKVIARLPSFHGSTLGTQSLGETAETSPLGGMLHPWPKVPAPFPYRPAPGLDAAADATRCAEALRTAIIEAGPQTVLAFILEPVMGFSGGAAHAPSAYYRRVRDICDEFGVLLVFDEVMCGAGRTGKFLAAHHWPDVKPDLVVLAKGIASGYHPVAGFMAPGAMVDTVVGAGGFHLGHTQKASPLACAVSLAVLRELRDRELIANADMMGALLRRRLEELKDEIPIIGDVRGLGLMIGVEFVADTKTKAMLPRQLDVPKDISRIGMEKGLLLYARRTAGGRFGDWIMVAPPLIATRDQIEELVDLLRSTLLDYYQRLRRDGHLR